MTLIIEDGTEVANANSYITVAEYSSWANARFGASRTTAPACDQDAEKHILRAMDYFEAQEFQGYKVTSTQVLQWPRSWVEIDGFAVETNEIPKEVKNSIYELAYADELGQGELASVDRKTKKEKVGDIEVEYADSSSSQIINLSVPSAMKKLLKNGGGGFRVYRV